MQTSDFLLDNTQKMKNQASPRRKRLNVFFFVLQDAAEARLSPTFTE